MLINQVNFNWRCVRHLSTISSTTCVGSGTFNRIELDAKDFR